MKIIDLLNKIANGEEVPKKIHYNCVPLYWCEPCKIYETMTDDELCGKDLYTLLDNLNDEVEIVEEEKKIPEKLEEFGLIQYNLDYIDYKNIETLKEWLNKDFQTIYDTLDLIIKNQNKLIDYLKSKGE